ncbi:monovalent cation/H(+) antiporter subunit G [Micromonospora sp. NPDC007271]|uniref:monovalent cation/H(+) antiporter subunit G n=1 Tax=Micromonospora sp. NPDC007271 TaxID=3154587 RepID=UPI0033FD1A5B
MSPGRVAAALVAAGVLVCVASSLGVLLPRTVLGRIHFLTPVTSVGAPLVGVGLAIDSGWQLPTALILFTTLVLAATGPVLAAAMARVAAQRQGLVPRESPE